MQLVYGAYSFAVNSVNSQATMVTKLGTGGLPVEVECTLECDGVLECNGTQEDATEQAQALTAALMLPYQDLILYQDNLSPNITPDMVLANPALAALLLPPPVLGAASLQSGGNLPVAVFPAVPFPYFYVLTATNAAGESLQSNEVSASPVAPNLTIVLSWTSVPGATGYNIYRSLTSGVYTTPSLLTKIGSGATISFVDNGTQTPGPGTPPLVGTAYPPSAPAVESATVMRNAGSTTGVVVVGGADFTKNTGGEYSTMRSCYFKATATYPPPTHDQQAAGGATVPEDYPGDPGTEGTVDGQTGGPQGVAVVPSAFGFGIPPQT